MTQPNRFAMVGVCLVLTGVPARLSSQQPTPSSIPTPKLSALLFAGAVALLPLDAAISEELGDPWPQHNTLLRTSAVSFNRLGDPGSAIIAAAAWGAGLATGSHDMADFGLNATESIAASSVVTGLLKGMVGRARPSDSPDDADEYRLGGGFNRHGATSFPSGHTTAAFALATTLVEEVRLRDPRAAMYVTPAAYGAAGLVGLARVYSQRHWSSDVLLGAAIGTYTAHRIFQYHHRKRSAAP